MGGEVVEGRARGREGGRERERMTYLIASEEIGQCQPANEHTTVRYSKSDQTEWVYFGHQPPHTVTGMVLPFQFWGSYSICAQLHGDLSCKQLITSFIGVSHANQDSDASLLCGAVLFY